MKYILIVVAILLIGCQSDIDFLEISNIQKITIKMEQNDSKFIQCMESKIIPADNLTQIHTACLTDLAQKGGIIISDCQQNPQRPDCQAVSSMINKWQQQCAIDVEDQVAKYYLELCS